MDFLKGASGTEILFWAFAVFGTLFFFLRVAMMVIGGFGAEDIDGGDVDVDVDADGFDADHADARHSDALTASDTAFKIFSIHSITGFFMMFGWAGLAAYKQYSLGAGASIGIASAVGVATMFASAYLMKLAMGLASPGTRFTVKNAVGERATVYLKIPADGRGKIQVSHHGITRIVEAVSEGKKEIDSFKTVKVVRVVDPKTVSVSAVKDGK